MTDSVKWPLLPRRPHSSVRGFPTLMKRRRDTIVMPIETTARELLPKLFLAIKFAEAGFVSYLGLKSMTHEVAVRSGRAIYLDKGYHPGVSEQQYEKLRRAGCLIVNLDEENGVDFKDFHMLNVRMPDQLFSLVDHILVWGQAQYDHLRAHRPSFDPNRISVTGHPRFDLLKSSFRGLYAEKVRQLEARYGPFILLNTNTKFGNNINGRDFIIENYGSRVKGLLERLEYDDQRLESNMNLARRLAEETRFNVVLRPHPEEDISVYHQTFADQPKIHPIYDDTPVYWLLAADLVIHNHSTTGLEAALLGKTPISFSPLAVDEGFVPWIPIACSLQVTSETEVIDFARKHKSQWQPAPDIGDILENFFSYERSAGDQVVEVIERLAESELCDGVGRGLSGYLAKLKIKGLLRGLKGDAAMGALARNKLRDLTPSTVNARFAELLAQGIASRSVGLEALHPLLYRISPR